jgi:Right handed beta helix region
MGARRWPAAVLVLGVLALPGTALAQATRTWVSGVGDDANPCSRTAPCKTFAGAISKTAAGGEINALDPGGFGAVTITKAITISGVGVTAGVLVSGTNGIVVAAGPTDRVTLEGLDIDGLAASPDGIKYTSGARLTVEDSQIYGFGVGIDFESTTAGSKLTIDNTRIHDNTGDGVLVAPPSGVGGAAVLENDQLDGNGCGVAVGVEGVATPTVTNCGLASTETTPATGATVAVADSSISSNTGAGVLANGSGAKGILSTDLITGNGTGLDPVNGGSIVELGANNSVLGNTTDGTPTSTVSTGAVGPAGTNGANGANGKNGAAGDIELVTCKQVTKTVTVKVHGKKKKRKKKEQVCTGKLVSGKVKFTVAGKTMHATLTRSNTVYAQGTMIVGTSDSKGLLSWNRKLRAGRYTLTLWKGARAVSRRSIELR